jgi:pSer/pThr/pTyr-binding forkhead associated (FHA) protein
MVQINVLSGRDAGAVYPLQRLPALIGRNLAADIRLEDPGIWDRHLQIEMAPDENVIFSVLPGSWALINGRQFESAPLRNGDLVEIGSVKLQFWLSQTRQRSLRLREAFTWVALGLLCAAQVALICYIAP